MSMYGRDPWRGPLEFHAADSATDDDRSRNLDFDNAALPRPLDEMQQTWLRAPASSRSMWTWAASSSAARSPYGRWGLSLPPGSELGSSLSLSRRSCATTAHICRQTITLSLCTRPSSSSMLSDLESFQSIIMLLGGETLV